MRRHADVVYGEATLLTSPSSGQATTNSLLRHPRLPACHSGAAFEGCDALDASQQDGVALP